MEPVFSKKRSFVMRNLDPQNLRRNLRRVITKTFWGGVEIKATLQNGKIIETFTCGEVLSGMLMGYGLHGPKKDPKLTNIKCIKIAVAEIVRLKVTYDPIITFA